MMTASEAGGWNLKGRSCRVRTTSFIEGNSSTPAGISDPHDFLRRRFYVFVFLTPFFALAVRWAPRALKLSIFDSQDEKL